MPGYSDITSSYVNYFLLVLKVSLPTISTFRGINASSQRKQAINTPGGLIRLPYTGTGNATCT
jgi:hypothetical protein